MEGASAPNPSLEQTGDAGRKHIEKIRPWTLSSQPLSAIANNKIQTIGGNHEKQEYLLVVLGCYIHIELLMAVSHISHWWR